MRQWIDLVEGRDAPLYHGTSICNGANALHLNMLFASHAYEDDPFGVSLTRDLNVAKDFHGEVIFALDQRALAQRYKITPFAATAHDGMYHGKHTENAEYEEVVHGNIVPLDHYLLWFTVDEAAIAWLKENPKTRLDADNAWVMTDQPSTHKANNASCEGVSPDVMWEWIEQLLNHPKRKV